MFAYFCSSWERLAKDLCNSLSDFSKEGIAFLSQPRIYIEKDIPSNQERAKIIKEQGCLAINQIHHGGGLANKEYSGLSLK